MLLIRVTHRPGFYFPYEQNLAEVFIRNVFGPALPALFAENATKFGMDEDTPEEVIQVQFDMYGKYDINTSDIGVTVQFSEEQSNEDRRFKIRDAVSRELQGVFDYHALIGPFDLIIDVRWGPINGRGTVNGVEISF